MVCMRVALAAFVLGTVGCVVVPYGEDSAKQKRQATTTGAELVEAVPARPRADARADAGPPPRCEAQDVTWGTDDASCTAALEAPLEPGASQTLTDTTSDATGKVKVTCIDGRLTTSDPTCELPKQLDLDNSSGCGNGYCSAVTSGKCGVPDENKATAICVFKGYTKQVGFTTKPGPNNVRQCHADGTGCFVNANPSCNIVFATVTCAR